MDSPIGWVGGKRRLRRAILPLIPQHETYGEVFAGAAWVLFGKPEDISGAEFVNDINGELSGFYRMVRERPSELTEALRYRLISQEDFLRERASSAGSEIERAARFFWVVKVAFGSRIPRASFGYQLGRHQRFRIEHIEAIISRAHERLRNVVIFCEDYERFIGRLDRSTTFFYCDPPYWGCSGCYEHEFTDAEHERLAAVLKGMSGKFLLSYNDVPEIRELYRWAEIEQITTRYSIARSDGARQREIGELLIRNYEPPKTSAK